MTPTPLTPDEVVFRFRDKGISVDPKARAEIAYWLARLPDAGLVVVEATAPDTTPPVLPPGVEPTRADNHVLRGGHPYPPGWVRLDGKPVIEGEIAPWDVAIVADEPEHEGLVPDPREPGTWLGRARDIPDGWEARRYTSSGFGPIHDDVPVDTFVQARPPQTTTSPPRWGATATGDGWNLSINGKWMALVGDKGLAAKIIDALNAADAAEAAAPQPQDNWVFAQEAEGDRG